MAEKKIEKGQTFEAQETVDKYRAIYYGGASGDFNPIHIDAEFGKLVGLGGAILQGLCTLAFTSKTVTDWAGDPGRLKKLKCRFSAPVMIDEKPVFIKGAVAEVNGASATVTLSVTREGGMEVLRNVSAVVEA